MISLNKPTITSLNERISPLKNRRGVYSKVFEDLGLNVSSEVIPGSDYNILGKIRDNDNEYIQVWTPWLSRGSIHIAKVSDDGEFLVIGGGYLLDNELHIYRWNTLEGQYVKVWEAGSGILTRDVYDVAFGDSDNNNLIELAAACADGRVYLFEQAHISDPIANLENRFDFVWKSDKFFQASSVEFYDGDLDGVQDLIVGSWDNKIHIFEYTDHSGYPFAAEHWITLTERWNSTELDDKVQSLAVGDFNVNGLPDIVVGTLSGSIYIFENDGLILSPHGIEFPFPNDNNYRQIWNNSGRYQSIWHTIGRIESADIDGNEGTEAVILAWGQGAWVLRHSSSRGFYLEQLTQPFEDWSMQGYYPLDNFADWMVNDTTMNWQVYTQHVNGSKYPEPWTTTAVADEFDIFANSAATGAPAYSIHGGTIFNGNEYKLFETNTAWTDAKDACAALGGHLVTITSPEENAFVSALAGSNKVMIGLTDNEAYGGQEDTGKTGEAPYWVWITGEPLSYTNWCGGEPSPSGDEDYVELFAAGDWNDIANTNLRYYVCEWEGISTTFYTNQTHRNATGTWNLGVGEELASNGNEDPDLYILFGSASTTPDPDEWNISLSNNLFNWHQLNSTSITPLINGTGLAIDVDPLFATKKMMAAQYIRLTLIQDNTTDFKERRVHAIIFPNVARPLTVAASLTIEPLLFDYFEKSETVDQNKIIFGCTDGRILAFRYEPQTGINYYQKFTNKPAELTQVLKSNYGIVISDFVQEWDSFTDDFFNLEQTIWSIQGTPKKSVIPSWRYIKGTTTEFTSWPSNSLHYLDIKELDSTSEGGELIIAEFPSTYKLIIAESGGTGNWLQTTTENIFGSPAAPTDWVNGYPDFAGKVLTTVFSDISDDQGEELITFPWYETFVNPNPDLTIMPVVWKWDVDHYAFSEVLWDVDSYLYNYLYDSTTYPSAAAADMDNDTDNDLIISNGRLAMLWNIGNASDPIFKFDFDYFKEFNERAPPNPIFSPNAWDYDQDGDYDIAYSYGQGSGEFRYGMDFFENQGTPTDPLWVRNAYVMKNPTTDGSLRFNNYTLGVIIPSNANEKSADSLWVWNGVEKTLRNLIAETDQQSSFIIGTNPELMKLEINQKQSPPEAINFGYSILKSWTNLRELDEWTLTLTTSLHLDNDDNSEIIVSDFDNNVYVFEHLTENTYKRAWRSFDLNHTEETTYSPYAFQDLEGVSGDFRKTLYDHGNLLASGLDYDKDGNEEFIITAALSIYIFEATGYNDEYKLIFEKDYQYIINDTSITQFTALAITPDFDGRGSMVAIAAKNYLCLLRADPQHCFVESFQSVSGSGFYGVPGVPTDYPFLDIRTLLFADLNQDENIELWIGGQNSSETSEEGFLLALDSNYGDIHKIFDFPAISTIVNALETTDADYDGFIELIIAHGHGLDIWEANNDPDIFQFTLLSYISSDPNYGQSQQVSPVFDTYQSPTGLAPRSQDIFHLQGGNEYFSIYGVEENTHDPVLHQDIGGILQNGTTGGGKLYYTISQDPTTSGIFKDPEYQISESLIILITEVYYPVVASQQWVELYNPSCHNISLDGWRLDFANETSSFSVPLNGTIYAYDYFVIVNDEIEFTSQYPSAPSPNLENSSLNLGDDGQLQLINNDNEIEDLIEWGGGSYWNLIASGTSLVRNDSVGYIGSIIPRDTNLPSDWLNVLPSGQPGQGNYSAAPSMYEYRPAITQGKSGTITVAWIVEYVSPSDGSQSIYGRSVNIRQFTSTGTPLTTNFEVDSIMNTNGSTFELYYTVVYEDVAVVEINGDILVAYIANDIETTTSISKNLYVQYINTTDWTKTNLTDQLGINENYTVSSIDFVVINNQIGLFFSGSPRNSFASKQIYYTILNSTYQNQGIVSVISGTEDYDYVSVTKMLDNPNNIFLCCEHVSGGKSELILSFSKDSGDSWSQEYVLFSDDPNLEQYDIYGSLRTKESQVPVINRQIIRPRVTTDNTGGIYYQFVTRFLLPEGSDLKYFGNLVDYYGAPHHLVTQQWIGQLVNGIWFDYDDISNVRAIAVGDSDNDLRTELFISHDTRVSLLEISQDELAGEYYYTQKWQYEPPSFLSASPEQVNSSYVQYLVSDTDIKRETGSVAIADTNGNGWPELIFTVLGGDVFSFELKNQEQPINDIYLITERDENITVEFPVSTDILITEVMYNPADPEAIWIELYNPTSSAVDLSGWKISTSSYSFTLPPLVSRNISAKGYFVIAKNSATINSLYSITPDIEKSDFTLSTVGDTLTLEHSGTIVDEVSWGFAAQIQGYDLTANNQTIRRLNLHDTDSGDDWENSRTFGNPGTDLYYSLPPNISENYLVDCNNDTNLDLVIADRTYGRGLIAWDLMTNNLIWHRSIQGKLDDFNLINNGSDQVIVCISSKGVLGLNLNGSKRYWISAQSNSPTNSHIFVDVNQDAIQDLILATTTDVRAIQTLKGDKIWNNPSIDDQSLGYFDISSCIFKNETYIGVSSSDFATYRKINVLHHNGSVLNSFDHTSLVKFDANSRSILGDFNLDGQLDILLVILDNYNNKNPKSRIEVWNTETKQIRLNDTLPILQGTNIELLQIIPYDVNNDSLNDLILAIPEFNDTISSALIPTKGFSSGIFALNIASGGTILWSRYFKNPLINFEIETANTDKTLLFAQCKYSGIFGISRDGSDVTWMPSDDNSAAVGMGFDEEISFWVSYANGTCDSSKVIGKLSSAVNIITETPYILKTATNIYNFGEAYVIPVKVSLDNTEKLLVAYTNGTLILRSLQVEFWRVQIEPFSRISATGLILDEIKQSYGLAYKTNTGNLIVLDKTSTKIVSEKITKAENISAVNLGLNSDLLLMQTILGSKSIFSLYDYQTNAFIWNYTNSAYLTYWDVASLNPSLPGIITHIIALDYLGNAHIIDLPTASVTGGMFPAPSLGGTWLFVKTLENEEQVTEVYLLSNKSQLIHYSWLPNGDLDKKTYNLPIMDVISWSIVREELATNILLTTRNDGIKIYKEELFLIPLIKEEINYYLGSYDHQFSNLDGKGENELILITGNALVVKNLSNDNVNEIYSFSSLISSVKIWNVDTSRKPVMVATLIDGTIAIADPQGRSISVGAAAEFTDLIISPIEIDDSVAFSSSSSIYKEENGEDLFLITIFSFSTGVVMATGFSIEIIRRKRTWNDEKRRFKK
ncbi:MAG: lamin tail domain-containing protein [Promethearchaeota archaeon]